MADQRTARQALAAGSFLVLLHTPEGLDVGLDCSHQRVLPQFRGFKMLPRGLHFLHYGWGGQGGDAGHREGMFFEATAAGEVLVLLWDAAEEAFVRAAARRDLLPEGAEAKLRRSVQACHLDSQLAPYAGDGKGARRWSNLVNGVSKTVLRDVRVELMELLAADETAEDGVDWEAAKMAAEAEAAAATEAAAAAAGKGGADGGDLSRHRPRMAVDIGEAFAFETPLRRIANARRKRRAADEVERDLRARGEAPALEEAGGGEAATATGERRGCRRWTDVDELWMGRDLARVASIAPEKLSQAFLDVSDQLTEAVETTLTDGSPKDGWLRLLGEWQLAFVLAVWLLDGPALRQWQHLSHMLLTAEGLARARPDVVGLVGRITVAQLHFVPDELLHQDADPHTSGEAAGAPDRGRRVRSFYTKALSAFLRSLLAHPEPLPNPIPSQEVGLKLHRALESRTGRKWPLPSNARRLGDAAHRENAARLFNRMQQYTAPASGFEGASATPGAGQATWRAHPAAEAMGADGEQELPQEPVAAIASLRGQQFESLENADGMVWEEESVNSDDEMEEEDSIPPRHRAADAPDGGAPGLGVPMVATPEAHAKLEERRSARRELDEIKRRYGASTVMRLDLDPPGVSTDDPTHGAKVNGKSPGSDEDTEDEDGPTLVLPQELAELVGGDDLVGLLGNTVAWRGPDGKKNPVAGEEVDGVVRTPAFTAII